jgi:hypothetical protein
LWYVTLIKLVRYLNLKSAPIGLFNTRRHRFPTNYLLQATHSLQCHIVFHLHDHIVCTRVPDSCVLLRYCDVPIIFFAYSYFYLELHHTAFSISMRISYCIKYYQRNRYFNLCLLWSLTPPLTISRLYRGGPFFLLFLLVEETGEKHRPVASNWQTLSHNVISSMGLIN